MPSTPEAPAVGADEATGQHADGHLATTAHRVGHQGNQESAGRGLVVAAAIVDDLTHPHAVLAARRSAPPDLAGRWEFPGGKVEPREAPRQALHRELAEELGVTVRLGPELAPPPSHGRAGCWPLAVDRDGIALTMRLWLATLVAGTPHPLQDHDALRMIDIARWAELDWLDGDRPALAQLARMAIAHSHPDLRKRR